MKKSWTKKEEHKLFCFSAACWVLDVLNIYSNPWWNLVRMTSEVNGDDPESYESHVIGQLDMSREMLQEIFAILENNPMIEDETRRTVTAVMKIGKMLGCLKEIEELMEESHKEAE